MCLLTLLLLTVGGHTKSDAERDQKKIKEAFEKKIAEQDKKHEDTKRELEEQTVKHERAQRSAAEIEDSLRSELKRLKEEKPPDYIKMLSDTASETAQGISETAQEHYKTLKQKSGEAWEATSEFHESNVKPAVEDFVNLHGSNETFTNRLEQLFTESSEITGDNVSVDISGLIGQYAHGNEPSHHIAYMFNHANQPWRTQYWARYIMDTQYNTTPVGLSGNEDC